MEIPGFSSQITEARLVTEGHGHLDLTCAQQEACWLFFKRRIFIVLNYT